VARGTPVDAHLDDPAPGPASGGRKRLVGDGLIHGLPLVPPVNPSQSNRSWAWLCRDVQFTHVTGASALAG
jgi:hypothetical protein